MQYTTYHDRGHQLLLSHRGPLRRIVLVFATLISWQPSRRKLMSLDIMSRVLTGVAWAA